MAKERLVKGGLTSAEADKVVKAYNDGKLTKNQYEKLPPKLLKGIVNSNKKPGAKKKKKTKK